VGFAAVSSLRNSLQSLTKSTITSLKKAMSKSSTVRSRNADGAMLALQESEDDQTSFELELEMEKWLIEAVQRLSMLDNTVVPFKVRQSLETDRLSGIKQALKFKGVYKKTEEITEIARLLGCLSHKNQCEVKMHIAKAALRAGDLEFARKTVLQLISQSRYRPAWKLCLQLSTLGSQNEEVEEKLKDADMKVSDWSEPDKKEGSMLATRFLSSVLSLAENAAGAQSVSSSSKSMSRDNNSDVLSSGESLIAHCLWGCDDANLSGVLERWTSSEATRKHVPTNLNVYDILSLAGGTELNKTSFSIARNSAKKLCESITRTCAHASREDAVNLGLAYASAIEDKHFLTKFLMNDLPSMSPNSATVLWEIAFRYYADLAIRNEEKSDLAHTGDKKTILRHLSELKGSENVEFIKNAKLFGDRWKSSLEVSSVSVPFEEYKIDEKRFNEQERYRNASIMQIAESFDSGKLEIARRISMKYPGLVQWKISQHCILWRVSNASAKDIETKGFCDQLWLDLKPDLPKGKQDWTHQYLAFRTKSAVEVPGKELTRVTCVLDIAQRLAGKSSASSVISGHLRVVTQLRNADIPCDYWRLSDPRTHRTEMQRIVQTHNVYILAHLCIRLCNILRNDEASAVDMSEHPSFIISPSQAFDLFLRKELSLRISRCRDEEKNETRKQLFAEFIRSHVMFYSRLDIHDLARNIADGIWDVVSESEEVRDLFETIGVPLKEVIRRQLGAAADEEKIDEILHKIQSVIHSY